MSLRKQAKILGISAPYLSQMINGKRPWNLEVKARYEELVANTFANTFTQTEHSSTNTPTNSLHATLASTGTKNVYNIASQLRGAVAHLGERFNGIEEVGSSILPSSTIYQY